MKGDGLIWMLFGAYVSADRHSGLNLNIQIQKLVFRFNSIQKPIVQYSGFIQNRGLGKSWQNNL
jgi:hypothetical protein